MALKTDGAQNVNRIDGGYALKIPVDAIAGRRPELAEFRPDRERWSVAPYAIRFEADLLSGRE
jgi:hypothetical protein